MKVQGPGQSQATSKTKKSGKTASSEGNFGDFVSGETPESATTTATQSIAQVDALLAIQGAEDPTERASRGRAYRRSNTILDGLEKIRMAMLSGNLTVGHMVDIADVVAAHREKIMDPQLTDIMDEIDLRAQVELAKMRVTLDEQKQKA
ncbi:MAG: flagellar assembly protein FliX [Micavibrio sp.]|nr:MAG: flagellar assembly protein FliX [Micavibrio sp.]